MGDDFLWSAAAESRLMKRSAESLLGICKGLMADSRLNDEEILYLDNWLANNREFTSTWPGDALSDSVREILADGEITIEEREQLERMLSDLIGGTLQETGAAEGMATRLPIDDIESIDFDGASFCFTGKFAFGEKADCKRAVVERGGIARSQITKDLNFLVVGKTASEHWKYTSYGTKIQKVLDYKAKGCSILIVSEEQWKRCL